MHSIVASLPCVRLCRKHCVLRVLQCCMTSLLPRRHCLPSCCIATDFCLVVSLCLLCCNLAMNNSFCLTYMSQYITEKHPPTDSIKSPLHCNITSVLCVCVCVWGGGRRNVYKILLRKPEGKKNHFEDLHVDGTVTLKWI
jgi:hypothetical protein